jgi:predicted nucleotidyltransferase
MAYRSNLSNTGATIRTMIIDPKETIDGQPAKRVRDILRRLGWVWTRDDLEKQVGNRALANKLFAGFKRRGWIQLVKDARSGEYYECTLDGSQFRKAHVGKGIARSKAEQALQGLLARVRQVNADDYWLYRVKRVVVFGSYLSNKPVLGDVDVAVELEQKATDPDERVRLLSERSREALMAGRRFSNFLDQIGWAETEVKLFLKNRDRWLQLAQPSDAVLTRRSTKTKVVFELRRRGSRRTIR